MGNELKPTIITTFDGKTTTYAPGYFLADTENFITVTKTMYSGCTDTNCGKPNVVKVGANGGKYVPAGSLYKEGEKVVGLVYEDVDVTDGDSAGAVVISGTVYKDRLPEDAVKECKECKCADKDGKVHFCVPAISVIEGGEGK